MILDFQKTEDILKEYGIKTPKTFFVSNKEELFLKAEELNFPLVLKISSKTVLHRKEVGGVFTNITKKEELEDSFNRLEKIKEKEGVLLQEQIKGVEFIVGAKEDSSFGTVVMLGTGGSMVEIFNDLSFRLAPVDKKEALEMIEEVKGKIMLEGFRGEEKLNKEDFADFLVKVSKLAFEKKVKELDFNPVIINKDGVFVCDVKIIL